MIACRCRLNCQKLVICCSCFTGVVRQQQSFCRQNCCVSVERRESCWMSSGENDDHACSETSRMSTVMYVGAFEASDWCTRKAILNSIRLWTGSQCSWRKTGVTWLYWLRSPKRIDFKLAVLVYRCLHGLAPRYLSDCIQIWSPIY